MKVRDLFLETASFLYEQYELIEDACLVPGMKVYILTFAVNIAKGGIEYIRPIPIEAIITRVDGDTVHFCQRLNGRPCVHNIRRKQFLGEQDVTPDTEFGAVFLVKKYVRGPRH